MKRLFYLLLLLSAYLPAQAQHDTLSINAIVQKAIAVNNDHPVEKVYFHFDKPYYAVGDTMWFKGYVTMDIHQSSTISRVVNIDIIGQKDSVIESLKIPVNNGVATGSVVLNSNTYHQGNYRFRAFTRWMMNFKQSYMFDKTISIGSALHKEVYTQIAFSDNANDKGAKLGARVLYKDKDGIPLVNKHVDWTIQTNGDAMLKGRGNTDAHGYLDVTIADNKITNFAGSSLVTSIEVADKKIVDRSFPLKNAFNGADLQFFPEGGILIADVPMQVAFKAIQTNGLGIGVKGTIVDAQGKEVAQFASQHLGMGKTSFTPERNNSYKAIAEFADGTKATFQLPRVASTGIALAVNNANSHEILFQINSSPGFFERNKDRMFYILAQSGGFVVYAAQTRLSSASYIASIPKSKFKTGVVQLSLLATEGDVLTERLLYIDRSDNLNIALSSDKPSYSTRQRVAMKAVAKQAGQPVAGNFSVSVIDETKTPFNDDAATTILTHLLLTSDITGYVEQPNYYFNQPDPKKADDLDVLMMTQGFRGFDMDDVVSGKIQANTFAPEQGIDFSGNLRKLNGIPVFKGAVRLVIPDKNFSTETTTDADGNFVFRNIAFTDSSKVIISARNNPDARNLKITMNGDFYPAVTPSLTYPDEIVNIDSTMNQYLLNSEKQYAFNKVLKEVTVRSTTIKKPTNHEKYSTLNLLPQIADHEIKGDRFADCPSFLVCLEGSLPGITFNNGNFYITRNYTSGNALPVQFYMKGMPIDVTSLNSINSAEVESVEVFLNDGLSGINKMTQTQGVVSINMKDAVKGEKISLSQLNQMLPEENTVTITPKGYLKVRHFYSPKYLVPRGSLSVDDLRTTLYWNPNVTTDKTTGVGLFDFYNGDARGVFKAVIEGIDADGNIGRAVYRYTVR